MGRPWRIGCFNRLGSRIPHHTIKRPLAVDASRQVIGVGRVGVRVGEGEGVDGGPVDQIGAPLDLIRLVRDGVPAEADLAGGDVGDFDGRADFRGEDKAVGDAAVDACGSFVVEDAGSIGRHGVAGGAVAADVVGDGLIGADGDADVAAVGQQVAGAVGTEIDVLAVRRAAEAGVVRGAGLRAFEIDDAVFDLVAIQVVMAVEDNVDLVLHEQVMDWHLPAGTLGGETGAAVGVFATPLVFVAHFDAAACGILRGACGGLRAAADDVVHEDELVSRAAVLQRGLEPVILRFAEAPVPCVVGGVWIGHRVPEGVEHDEERLAPFEGVEVLQQAKRAAGVILWRWIAGVEGVRRRSRVEGFAGLQVPGGDVVLLVGGGGEEVAVFRLVIAESEEERDAMAGTLEGIAEEDRAVVDARLVDGDTTAPFRGHTEQAVGKLVGHEDVAHVHVDVRLVEADVLHRTPEELHVRVHIDVRIGSDGEAERRAARPCGVEAALAAGTVERSADIPMAHPIVILGVRLQTGDRDADRVLKLRLGVVDVERRRRGARGVLAGSGAVFDKDLLIDRCDEVQGHPVRLRQRKELRADDGGIGEEAVHGVEVVAASGAGGAGVRVIGGDDFEVDRRAAVLRGDGRAPNAVIGRAIAVQAVVEHRERDGRRRRGGGDDDVVNADARSASRSRGGVAGGLEADLRLRAEFCTREVIMEELEAVVHRCGKSGADGGGARIRIRGSVEHEGGRVRDAAHGRIAREVVGGSSSSGIGRGGVHQSGRRAGDEGEGRVRRDGADAGVVRNARGGDEHAFDKARGVRAGRGGAAARDADGHIHRRGEHRASCGESGGAGAGHGCAASDRAGGVQHHIAQRDRFSVPIFAQTRVPGRAVVGGDLHRPAAVVRGKEIACLHIELDEATRAGGVDRVRRGEHRRQRVGGAAIELCCGRGGTQRECGARRRGRDVHVEGRRARHRGHDRIGRQSAAGERHAVHEAGGAIASDGHTGGGGRCICQGDATCGERETRARAGGGLREHEGRRVRDGGDGGVARLSAVDAASDVWTSDKHSRPESRGARAGHAGAAARRRGAREADGGAIRGAHGLTHIASPDGGPHVERTGAVPVVRRGVVEALLPDRGAHGRAGVVLKLHAGERGAALRRDLRQNRRRIEIRRRSGPGGHADDSWAVGVVGHVDARGAGVAALISAIGRSGRDRVRARCERHGGGPCRVVVGADRIDAIDDDCGQ